VPPGAPSPPRVIGPRPPVEPAHKFKPRSVEDQVRLAYWQPAPNSYNPKRLDQRSLSTLGKISESRIPSALDHGSYERSLVPGPGSYDTPATRETPLPEGGRLSRKPPQEKFKLDEYPSPPPGTYGIPIDPTLPRQLYGAFGKDPRVTKFIEDEVKRSRSVPAPGAHDVVDSMESVKPFCPEGGRYLDQVGRDHSYFDAAAKLKEGSPGPDRYNLPGAMRKPPAGRLVWKYQSETLESTKKVIKKIVGDGSENPAPGTYTLPDPPALGPSPKLKGRSLGHSMPHPFAYNCSPDHSRKFDALAPVISHNSGEQIYGRDLTKGTRGRAAQAKVSADEVAAANMPLTLAEREIEQPGETVQWRSGGFNALRRVHSTPAIVEEVHPAMECMMKHYPSLSKKHGRQDNTFIPNAIRKPEIVKTYSKSKEHVSLQRRKWELGIIAGEMKTATDIMLEPLDEGKLRAEATRGLMDKAKYRMRMEGLSKDQQDLVLAEFPGVLLDNGSPAPPDFGSAEGFGMDGMFDEGFEEPMPA